MPKAGSEWALGLFFPSASAAKHSLKSIQLVKKMVMRNIYNFILFLCGFKEKSRWGNYTEQSFACITQPKTKERLSKARCVSPSKKKKTKNTLSVKRQPHLDAQSSRALAARRLERLNMQDFRFRKRPPFHVVYAASIILTPTFTGVTD